MLWCRVSGMGEDAAWGRTMTNFLRWIVVGLLCAGAAFGQVTGTAAVTVIRAGTLIDGSPKNLATIR